MLSVYCVCFGSFLFFSLRHSCVVIAQHLVYASYLLAHISYRVYPILCTEPQSILPSSISIQNIRYGVVTNVQALRLIGFFFPSNIYSHSFLCLLSRTECVFVCLSEWLRTVFTANNDKPNRFLLFFSLFLSFSRRWLLLLQKRSMISKIVSNSTSDSIIIVSWGYAVCGVRRCYSFERFGLLVLSYKVPNHHNQPNHHQHNGGFHFSVLYKACCAFNLIHKTIDRSSQL